MCWPLWLLLDVQGTEPRGTQKTGWATALAPWPEVVGQLGSLGQSPGQAADQAPSLGRYNEVNAISTACSSGLPECQSLVSGLFNQWMNNPENNL